MIQLKQPLLLASTSPRRQFLMKEIGFTFQIEKPDGDESFSSDMAPEKVPAFLAKKKAESLRSKIKEEIVLAADTVVILGNRILNKPADENEAIQMLSDLSGQTHLVITAVCLLTRMKQEAFEEKTFVTFKKLGLEEIKNYVATYKPLDKAGAYGAQDCLPSGVNPCSDQEIGFLKRINNLDLIEKSISTKAGKGMDCISKIDGSYFNVMGLPIQAVYNRILEF